MTNPDKALLLFGDDHYFDEFVLPMTFEQLGVYELLRWVAHKNGSLPADPELIAKLLGLPSRRLSVKRFLAKVWPGIEPCWTSTGDGRLVQKRQEAERDRREVARGGTVAGDQPATGSKAEKCRASANVRWERYRQRMAGDATSHAKPDANAHASACATDANRIATHDANACPPAPPSEKGSEANPPSEGARAHANAHANSHANDAIAEGARAPHAEQSGAESVEDEEVRAVAAAFEALPYFRTLTPAKFRPGSIRDMAEHAVLRQGFRLPYVAILDEADAERAAGGKVPRGSSLGDWMKEGTWCDEIGRRKHRLLRVRDSPARPTSEPLLARSLVDGAVQQLLGGA